MSTKNETIVDRVVQRLKTQPLGDLITEEDLHDIVKQAIPQAFFHKRVLPDPGGYSRTIEKEPLIVEVFRELVAPTVKKAVEAWLVENAEITAEHWKKVLDKGLIQYVQTCLDDQASRDVRSALFNWINRINEERSKAGLPYIQV